MREHCLGGGEGVGTAAADADDAVGGFDDIAGAADDQAHGFIGDGEHGFEPAENAIGAPILGQLDDGAAGIFRVFGELFLEAFEEGERIGGGAGETGQDLAVADPADFDGIVLGDDGAQGDLTVAAEGDLIVFADGEDCCGSSRFHLHDGL